MDTFKKKFTIKGNNGWLEPPAHQRCGAAIKVLAALTVEMRRNSHGAFKLRILKSGLHKTKCELECPDLEDYETLKLLFLCEQGAYFDWRD